MVNIDDATMSIARRAMGAIHHRAPGTPLPRTTHLAIHNAIYTGLNKVFHERYRNNS